MGAIFKKEFRSFFTSPVGYIVFAVIAYFTGKAFLGFNISQSNSDLSGVFYLTFIISILVLPILTMKLFSEEKHQKTEQALLTSPVSLTGIVMGKFFATMLVFALSILILLVFSIFIAFQVTPNWSFIFGNFIGLLLVGGLVIAIGLLISTLTESQLIAALGTLAISFVILFMDTIASNFSNFKLLATIINFLSISKRYAMFTTGLIAYDDVIFFLSMQALILFITVRVLDSKRWS